MTQILLIFTCFISISFLLSFVFSKIELQTAKENKSSSARRQEKLFGLFTHITFPDVECETELGLRGFNTVSASVHSFIIIFSKLLLFSEQVYLDCKIYLFLPGVCLSPEKCGSRSGGKSKGQCAQGFGVCCVFIITSDDNINVLDQKVAYLRNQAFPQASNTNLVQTITLKPKDEDTSQLFVEFLEFQEYFITNLKQINQYLNIS